MTAELHRLCGGRKLLLRTRTVIVSRVSSVYDKAPTGHLHRTYTPASLLRQEVATPEIK